jgi:hypothetical protein
LYGLGREISKVVLYDLEVLFPLAFQHLTSEFLVDRNVVKQELPGLAPVLGKRVGDAIPRDVPQLVQLYVGLVRIKDFVYLHALLLGLALLDVRKDLVLVLLRWLIERRILYFLF